jgi:hypothetical protein
MFNSFELKVKAPNDIHIKISNKINVEYEIVIGGWKNGMSVIRENNREIFRYIKNDLADSKKYNNYFLTIINNKLNILKNNELIISHPIQPNFEIKEVCFKTGHESVADILFETTQNKGYYLMDTCENNWKNFYNYYNDEKFKDDVIMKCDDDIMFIDLYKLPKFIQFIRNNDYDLVFANTINNGVSAYYQQNKYNLIPPEMMMLEYPNGGCGGSLWENGRKAEALHNYFIDNYTKFLDYDYKEDIIPINSRYSINFFGYKGSKWHKIINAFTDNNDEYFLTVHYVNNNNFKNIYYSDFYVSHLSFGKQIHSGIDLNNVRKKYYHLIEKIKKDRRFDR